ncbi:MAG: hypothetical protein GXO02_00325 [Epsilonproteobacteria bacterium]|nr:hypothetical protein [Campylobacterota bacterium]
MRKKDKIVERVILVISDIIILIATFYIARYIREYLPFSSLPPFKEIALEDFLFVVIVTFILLFKEKIYEIRYDFWQE